MGPRLGIPVTSKKKYRRPRRKKQIYSSDLDADGRTIVASQLSEADFQNQLRTYARLMGWLYYHPHDSRRSDPGFPDTVLARGDRIIFAELKKVGGKVSPNQKLWLNTLSEHPTVEVYTWYPLDWDQIEEVLR